MILNGLKGVMDTYTHTHTYIYMIYIYMILKGLSFHNKIASQFNQLCEK